jgi:2-dehydro-3-deoxyphosphogluconate aldolase/(4S)-4-hydroxy-2-oxoglutarate aldolase
MAAREEIRDAIRSTGVIGEVRASSAQRAAELAQAMLSAGLAAVEISLITPDSLNVIAHARSLGMGHVGAGTVIDNATAEVALRSGAQFLASYTFDAEMVEAADEAGVLVIPGAGTVTEAGRAFDLGADFLRLFPVSAFGPDGVRDILEGLPNMPLIASGGVTLDNAADYIAAGCQAVSLGRALTDGGPEHVADRVARVLARVEDARRQRGSAR